MVVAGVVSISFTVVVSAASVILRVKCNLMPIMQTLVAAMKYYHPSVPVRVGGVPLDLVASLAPVEPE